MSDKSPSTDNTRETVDTGDSGHEQAARQVRDADAGASTATAGTRCEKCNRLHDDPNDISASWSPHSDPPGGWDRYLAIAEELEGSSAAMNEGTEPALTGEEHKSEESRIRKVRDHCMSLSEWSRSRHFKPVVAGSRWTRC